MQLDRTTIVSELGVKSHFDAMAEADRRIDFLLTYLMRSQSSCFVLGISGGVDSTVAGRLCQLAVAKARSQGAAVRFVAMRLPYGLQADEQDAQQALAFIEPDEVLTVNIRPASDAMLASLKASGQSFEHASQEDFVLGNIKARQRMIAQYAVAGARRGLVVGTDHAAEAVMGFFTKFGDGACDLAPLSGLTKGRVRELASHLGAPPGLVRKVPTADLESLRPQLPDESAFGVGYAEIDAFLEGRPVSEAAVAIIERFYLASRHKRALPAQPG
ncbi:ammonia-dependent NAD(+) synthetase [Caenimonas sedimenti]|uniref:NH(3)-dependent NAD(+) synthetase n=1 Tax=Caenimonas sedimenti TaxID=2596921 RepID=A0A562ZDT4_9BURK|nr:ammonia-dependent NAD(+) synthetase [Caenimonas sedimenti]TWO64427.1 ammonia-dependent NAD(+) synthetase [Caenimonas sedimenti]